MDTALASEKVLAKDWLSKDDEKAWKNLKKVKCPKCASALRKVEVKVAGAKSKAVSYQCPKCNYFKFEPLSSIKVVKELRK